VDRFALVISAAEIRRGYEGYDSLPCGGPIQIASSRTARGANTVSFGVDATVLDASSWHTRITRSAISPLLQ